jgi:YVTN family beta-propeller protein
VLTIRGPRLPNERIGAIALSIVLLSAFLVSCCASPSVAYTDEFGRTNGNQELLTDPSGQMVYVSDPSGNQVWIWDGIVADYGDGIEVGEKPVSLCLSQDGGKLFVACAESDHIAVVDVGTRQVVKNLTLDFSPWSVRAGNSERLYVTSNDDPILRVFDATSGALIASLDIGHPSIIEINPNGTQLIAAALSASPVKLRTFDLSSDVPSMVAQDNGTIDAGDLTQLAVDWEGGKLYCQSMYVIHEVDLGTLALLRAYYPWYQLASCALSPDRSILFALTKWPDRIEAISTESMNVVFSKDLSVSVGPLAISADGSSAFIGAPSPARLGIYPSLAMDQPSQELEYAYTPEHVLISLGPSIISTFSPSDLKLRIDGALLEAYVPEGTTNQFQAQLAGSLSDGTHSVTANLTMSGRVVSSSWTFIIDRDDPSALRPTVVPVYPPPDDDSQAQVGEVRCEVTLPTPAPLNGWLRLNLDGSQLPVVLPESLTAGEHWAPFSNLAFGEHTALAEIVYDGPAVQSSWEFIYRKVPGFVALFPTPSGPHIESPAYVSARYDPGVPAAELLSYRVSLDGTVLAATMQDDVARAEVPWPLGKGWHGAFFLANTTIGSYEVGWSFWVDAPLTLEYVNVTSSYRLPVPVGWTCEEDVVVGDESYDLRVLGDMQSGFRTNILVASGIDASLREDQSDLDAFVDELISELNEQGMEVVQLGSTEYRQVSNHSAAVIVIHHPSLYVTQKMVIVIDQDNFRYWLMVFSCADAAYEDYEPTFDAIIDGFQVTLEPTVDVADMMLWYIAIGAVVIVAAVLVLLFVMLRKRRTRGGAS